MAEKGIYREIEAQAKPYLDTRCNEIHVSVCYAMAERLLSLYPEADPEVVLPAILLHDVGWKMVPEEKQLTAFGPRANDMETRRIHEIEGVAIAAKYGPPRAGDVRDSQADTTAACRDLGHDPKFTFEQGMRATLEWYRKSLAEPQP